jgi:hypothetical protein
VNQHRRPTLSCWTAGFPVLRVALPLSGSDDLIRLIQKLLQLAPRLGAAGCCRRPGHRDVLVSR